MSVFPTVVGKSCFCLFLYHVTSLKKLDAREMFADYRSGPVYSGSSSKISFSAWLPFSLPLLTSQASAFVAGQFQEMLDGHPKASLPLSRQISLYKLQCSELVTKATHVHGRSPALEFLGSSFGQAFWGWTIRLNPSWRLKNIFLSYHCKGNRTFGKKRKVIENSYAKLYFRSSKQATPPLLSVLMNVSDPLPLVYWREFLHSVFFSI